MHRDDNTDFYLIKIVSTIRALSLGFHGGWCVAYEAAACFGGSKESRTEASTSEGWSGSVAGLEL